MENKLSLYEKLAENRLPRYNELPALELYKEQIVELTNGYLAPFYLNDKALTDTMVNNYVKLKVIAPPIKKRYRREQLAQLILTCLLKKVLSIAEVRQLLASASADGSIQTSYDYVCQELEQALKILSGGNSVSAEELSPQHELLDHAIWSFVHKLFFELSLAEEK